VEAKKMNTNRRTSLVAFLAIIPLAVMTGCSTSTPGAANPAGTTTSSTTSTSSPTAPNSTAPNSTAPNSTVLPPPAESAPTSPTSDASPDESGSDEPNSQQPRPSGPAVLPTDLSGEVYGYIRAVDVAQSQLTLDKIDWFTGAAAEQACAEDAVPQEARVNEWCGMYYFRNVNPALRVVTVSPDAVITTLEGNNPVRSTLSTLAEKAATELGNYRPYRLVVTNDAIIELTEIYQP
jgi:hypothetical protein